MEHTDLLDYEPKPLIIFEDENTLTLLRNPLYIPIVSILRNGPKTLKEIKEEYKKQTDKIPADKSLYRHLKILKDAGIITEAGRRVYTNQTLTEKLFGRTAYFFYTRPNRENATSSEMLEKHSTLLSKIFQLSIEGSKPTPKGLLEIINKINLSSQKSHDELFGDHAEELVEIFEGVSTEDLRRVIDYYWIIRLLLEKSDFDGDFKKYLTKS